MMNVGRRDFCFVVLLNYVNVYIYRICVYTVSFYSMI